MDALYRDYILDHYKNPRNFGTLEPHDLEHHDHNPLCGDELGVHLITDDGEAIQGSQKIVDWAKANPAAAAEATKTA